MDRIGLWAIAIGLQPEIQQALNALITAVSVCSRRQLHLVRRACIIQYDVAKIHVAEQAHFFVLMTRQLQTLLTALSIHTSQLMLTAFSNNQADRTQTAEEALKQSQTRS